MYMRDVKNKAESSAVNQNKGKTTAVGNKKISAQYLTL
jgi:hypothetical protein